MKHPRKIVLLTGSHLCNNPRVVKEADALSAAGFDVEVLGWIASQAQADEDMQLLQSRPWRFTPCLNLLDKSTPSRTRRLIWKIVRRAAYGVAQTMRLQTAAQLGGWRWKVLTAARHRPADLYIAHSATTIWVATRLARSGRRVGVDMEDWFSNEHPFPYPSAKIARWERALLRDSAHATCTSDAMSRSMAAEYGCPRPRVIYNAFPWAEREKLDDRLKDRPTRCRPSLHWFSQTIGPGRGLEDLFSALPLIKGDFEIHLRGTRGFGLERWLAQRIPTGWGERVRIHDSVPNAELLSRIAEHDIGFAGEMKFCASRDLTITNKILQYLLGGLAVIASDTKGQREVAGHAPNAVFIYPSGNAASLAGRIDELFGSPALLQQAKRAALASAQEQFSWERIAPELVESVRAAVEPVQA